MARKKTRSAKSAKEIKTEYKEKKKRRKSSGFHKFLLLQLFFIPSMLVITGTYFFSGINAKIKELKAEAIEIVAETPKTKFESSATTVCTTQGETVFRLDNDKKMQYLALENIPETVKQAFITTEDKKFYDHNGVDYKAIIRALITIIKDRSLSEGASTITQQLARNMFLTYEKTWERKIKEIFVSLELEKRYSKDEILEFYINNIYFANGYYGIQAASKGYFNKDVSQLSLSEAVFLCAIPNSPGTYDPIKNYDNTIKRRNRILKIMHDDRVINEEEYIEAYSTEIELKPGKETFEKQNYTETYIYDCATRALMETAGFNFRYEFKTDEEEKAYDEEYAKAYSESRENLRAGGYKIYTSIDFDKQEKLQDEIDSLLSPYLETNEEGIYQLQGAGVCINNETGYVEAIVGGRTQDLKGYTLNRAYQSYRQPGSTIKPILVYTPMIERGYTPDTIVTDKPIKDGPKNADGRYSGNMTLRKAVALSKNTIAWEALRVLTPRAALKYLRNMHFTHLATTDENLGIALGGFTYGVSAVEMAGAYSCMVNNGIFREPTCVTRITTAGGELVWERTETTKIYSSEATDSMIDMMQTVMLSGTGAGYALRNMSCAGKTGTTNDNKDSWFAGVTHYYTTVIWTAYDIPATLPGAAVRVPIQAWKNFMTDIHQDLENTEI